MSTFGIVTFNFFWCSFVFSQLDTTVNHVLYSSNESLVWGFPELHKKSFQFIDLKNYSDVYIIQTLGVKTSIEYYLINDSLVEKIVFRLKSPNQYDCNIISVPAFKFQDLELDSAKFYYELRSEEKDTLGTVIWIQHIRNGEILSGLYWTSNTKFRLNDLNLRKVKNFVNNIRILQNGFC